MKYGIDVSEFNDRDIIDRIKPDFAIIRAGYGYEHGDDSADHFVKSCERLNIPYGLYFFGEAPYASIAQTEAAFVLREINRHDWRPTVGIWYDVEESDYKTKNKWTYAKAVDIANTFCAEIEKAGYFAGIYANISAIKTYLGPGCPKYHKWVSWWDSATSTENIGLLRQYTNKPHDKDICYIDNIGEFFRNPKDKTDDAPQVPKKDAKTALQYALLTLKGETGTGEDRKKKLGEYYSITQAIINLLHQEGYTL